MLGQIAAFTIAATLVTLAPGADMALVARRAITDGWRRASVTSAGIVSGLLVRACYLVLLGLLSFRSARRTARGPGENHVDARPQRSGRTSFAQGFLNNV